MIRFVLTAATALWAAAAAAEIDIQEVTSPGGIEAWLVEAPEIPIVALEIRIRGGANMDLPGKRGATNLMIALIEEGSGDMDARTFQTELEGLAASFEFDVWDDAASISAQFLTENQDEAIALLRQAIVEPRFDQTALDRVRAQVVSGIRSREKDPQDIARAAFDAAAYGAHPYGSDFNGTMESVGALTRDDMIEAHARVLTRDNVYVGAVGDIDAAALGAMIDTLLGDLPEATAPLPETVPFGLGTGVTVIDFDTPQSTALFGHSGIARDDDDFFAAYVLNEILGGSGRQSRLMEEVREKRGLTYGVGSYLVPKDYSAAVMGSVASSNESVAEAIEVIRAEWQRIATEGVGAAELEEMKTYLTGAYPLRFDGNGRIANIMVGMQMVGLPTDYIATRNDQLNAVTLEDVNRVAAYLLQPENLHFVVVGKPEGLEATN